MKTAAIPRVKAGSRGRPEETREAIHKAALDEFAQEGLAGARTDAIARAAGVNKALLYYYYGDKEALYGAVLDTVFAGLSQVVLEALDSELQPRERILAWVRAHFDFLANNPVAPRLVQRELMRAGRSGSPHMRRLAESYLRPTFTRLMETLRAGIASGEFRQVDPVHFILSTIAMIVFYFGSTSMIHIMTHADPLSPERIRERRAAVLDMVAAALFTRPLTETPAASGPAPSSAPRRSK